MSSSISKTLEDLSKKNKGEDGRVPFLVKKTPFTSWRQVKNILEKVIMSIKSTIKRRLHECKYKRFTTRCKPLVTFRKKTRLEKASKVLESDSLDRWNQDKIESKWWKMKSLEKERKLIIQSIQHHISKIVKAALWHEYVWLPMEQAHWLCYCWQRSEVARWILRCIGRYSLLIFSQIIKKW